MTAARADHIGFRARSWFPGLDGLRALAILGVLLHHVPAVDTAWLRPLQENGRHGVSLFFVISGFLIASLLLRERDDRGGVSLGRFYARRTLRLLPLYYAVLAAECVLVLVLGVYSPENRALFAQKLPSYLFYYSNWLPTATSGPFFVAWSLAVEEQFYLVFALLLVAARGNDRALAAVCLAAVAAKAAIVALAPPEALATWTARIGLSYQEPILIGVLAALAAHHAPTYRILAAGAARLEPLAIVAAAALLVAAPIADRSGWQALLLSIAIALIVVARAIAGRTWLDGAFIAHLGRTSYCVYLVHMPVINVVKRVTAEPAICLAATVVVAWAIAFASWRWFEEPLIAWGRRRGRQAAAPAAAPA